MSAHLSRASALAGPTLATVLGLAWRRFRRAYAVALRDEVSRRNLRQMDDHMLSDIGISRAQANFEAEPKPWRYL